MALTPAQLPGRLWGPSSPRCPLRWAQAAHSPCSNHPCAAKPGLPDGASQAGGVLGASLHALSPLALYNRLEKGQSHLARRCRLMPRWQQRGTECRCPQPGDSTSALHPCRSIRKTQTSPCRGPQMGAWGAELEGTTSTGSPGQ